MTKETTGMVASLSALSAKLGVAEDPRQGSAARRAPLHALWLPGQSGEPAAGQSYELCRLQCHWTYAAP